MRPSHANDPVVLGRPDEAPQNLLCGILNPGQGFPQGLFLAVVKLDVVAGCRTRRETDGLADNKGHGFRLRLFHLPGLLPLLVTLVEVTQVLNDQFLLWQKPNSELQRLCAII